LTKRAAVRTRTRAASFRLRLYYKL